MGDPDSSGEDDYASASVMSFSPNTDEPDVSNTSLPGRIDTGVFAPQVAAYAHTNGTDSYTLTRVVTVESPITIAKVGVEQPDGTLVYEVLLADPVTAVSGDTVTITVTVTL
jgi:hypothetical protein